MSLPPIIGHAAQQKLIAQLLEGGKLPHALLFHGPEGIGKRLVAEHLACRLLCGPAENNTLIAEESDPLAFNTEHFLYPQIEARSTPQLHILERGGESKVVITAGEVRALLEKLSLASDGSRVIIIDGAEHLNPTSANGLLKTLEEPGKGIHFILVCHSPSKLLPTIISRCRQIRFSPLNQAETEKVIRAAAPESAPIDLLLKLADGCPGNALKLVGDNAKDLLPFVESLHSGKFAQENIQSWAEKLAKSTEKEAVFNIIRQYCLQQARAEVAPQAHATLHKKVGDFHTDMTTLNLTPALVMEAMLTEVAKVSQ